MIEKISDTQVQITIVMNTEEAARLPRHLNAIIQDMMILPAISPDGKLGVVCLIDIINQVTPSDEQFERMVQ